MTNPTPEHPAAEPATDPARRRRNRIMLVMVFAIGIVPLMISFWLYQTYSESGDFNTRNLGRLVLPATAWSDLDPQGDLWPGGEDEGPTWKLVLVQPQGCAEDCVAALDTLRAMHLLLTKDAQRVRRVLATEPELVSGVQTALSATYPRLQYTPMTRATLQEFAPRLGDNPGLLVVDPLGNVALSYTRDQIGKPLQKDLKQLLKASRIG